MGVVTFESPAGEERSFVLAAVLGAGTQVVVGEYGPF